MRALKMLFIGYLVVVMCCLGGLFFVSPLLAFWHFHLNGHALVTLQTLMHRAVELQILCGATLMLLVGFWYVGSVKTTLFFVFSLLLVLLTGSVLPGLFSVVPVPLSPISGFFFLLSWFFMGFASYWLACRLVVRLGLRRQTLWALLLGCYFLVVWNFLLNESAADARLPIQHALWQTYAASFSFPSYNVLIQSVMGFLFLGITRFCWRSEPVVQQSVTWAPFGVYTANVGLVAFLSFSNGLWFPALFSTCLVLFPESLAYFPREGRHPVRSSLLRALLSQIVWLVMRLGVLFVGRRHVRLKAEGIENIPRSGPVVIVARHFHYFFDGYILVRTVPRRLHTVVALDWVRSKSLRLLIELCCALADWPVILRGEQLSGRDNSQNWAYRPLESRQYLRQLISATLRLLRSAEVLVIFPEAYPYIDPHPTLKLHPDEFLPFRPGFIKLVELAERDHQTQVAIVPMGLVYTRNGGRWQVTARFGQALFRKDFVSADETVRTVEVRVQALSRSSSPLLSSPPGEVLPS